MFGFKTAFTPANIASVVRPDHRQALPRFGSAAVELHDLDTRRRERCPNPDRLILIALCPEREQPRCIPTARVEQAAAACAASSVVLTCRSRDAGIVDGVLLALVAHFADRASGARVPHDRPAVRRRGRHPGTSRYRMPSNTQTCVADPGKLSSRSVQTAPSTMTCSR